MMTRCSSPPPRNAPARPPGSPREPRTCRTKPIRIKGARRERIRREEVEQGLVSDRHRRQRNLVLVGNYFGRAVGLQMSDKITVNGDYSIQRNEITNLVALLDAAGIPPGPLAWRVREYRREGEE